MVKESLYSKTRDVIDSLTPFKNLKECEHCKVACKVTINRVFLFDFEVEKYPKDKLVKIDDHYFMKFFNKKPAYCSYLLTDKKGMTRCSIQEGKPLACVLSPLAVHRINSEPFWIFDGECLLSSKKENIENAKEFVGKLEKNLDNSILEELIGISGTIETHFPFEEKNIILIKKIELKKR